MSSFISKLKNLSPLTVHIPNLKGQGFLFFTFQRTIYTKSYLFGSCISEHRRIIFSKRSHSSGNSPMKFGQIVDLEREFKEWVPPRVKVKRKEPIRYSNVEVEEALEDEERSGAEVSSKKRDSNSYKNMERNVRLLSSLMANLKSKRRREKYQEVLLEGKRIIYDAIASGFKPKKIFYSRASDLVSLNLPENTDILRVPYKACMTWGDVVSPQGILGIFDMPDLKNVKIVNALPLTVVCDTIRDPGNLGSILRTCAALGCEKLLLIKGCCSLWEPKVIRSAAGAHFHFVASENVTWERIEDEISEDSNVFLADTDESNDREKNNPFSKKSVIASKLQLTPYYSVEFDKSTVLIIGGESQGLSEEAYNFTQKRNGTRICIPTVNNIQSLNSSVALAILAFEFKRQLNK